MRKNTVATAFAALLACFLSGCAGNVRPVDRPHFAPRQETVPAEAPPDVWTDAKKRGDREKIRSLLREIRGK